MNPKIDFRVIVEEPLAGVVYAVQRGKSDLVLPTRSTKQTLVFEFALTLADIDAKPPRLTGEFAQGPANERFVYVNTGSRAGQKHSPWTRRAKVPLYVLERALLQKALRGAAVVEARIHGIGKDGGPVCGTVPGILKWSIGKT